MTQFFKILPLFGALVAVPAWGAQPDLHAGHRPAEVAEAAKPPSKPDLKPGMHACSMMESKTASAADAPDDKVTKGKAPVGKMMMDGKDMHCMPALAAARSAEPLHDHNHPEASPK